MEALRNKSRFLLATDTLTGFAFAFFTYVTVFGGMGFASSQLYTATTSAVLLSAVLIFRSLRDLLIVPYFLRRIFKFFYERPLLFGTILFLPLTLTMIFRPLFMQVMFVDAGAVNQSIFQYFGAPPLHCDGCFQGSFLGDH